MKSLVRFFAASLWLSAIFPALVFGCSLSVKKLKSFDRAQHLLTGKVVGYTPAYEKKLSTATAPDEKPRQNEADVVKQYREQYREWGQKELKAYGLLIESEDELNLPEKPVGFFEVIYYRLQADCSSQGETLENLRREYPVGAKIRVAGIASTYFPNKPDQQNLRIDVLAASGILQRNDAPGLTFSIAAPDYDYKKLKRDGYPGLDLAEFALRADLLRLDSDASFSEKQKILERLIYFPHDYQIDYEAVVARQLPEDKARAEQLVRQRNEFLAAKETK